MDHHHHRLSPAAIAAAFKVAKDPSRLLSVADYWLEFEEPVDLLGDPQATFAGDTKHLRAACDKHGIAYHVGDEPAFPIWLLREFYTPRFLVMWGHCGIKWTMSRHSRDAEPKISQFIQCFSQAIGWGTRIRT
ncbi:MAG: hypothetical protein JWQ24_3906 [Tardiphaga sp.]|nr:hypothetical protein [Tardiphaga sp.]